MSEDKGVTPSGKIITVASSVSAIWLTTLLCQRGRLFFVKSMLSGTLPKPSVVKVGFEPTSSFQINNQPCLSLQWRVLPYTPPDSVRVFPSCQRSIEIGSCCAYTFFVVRTGFEPVCLSIAKEYHNLTQFRHLTIWGWEVLCVVIHARLNPNQDHIPPQFLSQGNNTISCTPNENRTRLSSVKGMRPNR